MYKKAFMASNSEYVSELGRYQEFEEDGDQVVRWSSNGKALELLFGELGNHIYVEWSDGEADTYALERDRFEMWAEWFLGA
jgi:hypothetical protein